MHRAQPGSDPWLPSESHLPSASPYEASRPETHPGKHLENTAGFTVLSPGPAPEASALFVLLLPLVPEAGKGAKSFLLVQEQVCVGRRRVEATGTTLSLVLSGRQAKS